MHCSISLLNRYLSVKNAAVVALSDEWPTSRVSSAVGQLFSEVTGCRVMKPCSSAPIWKNISTTCERNMKTLCAIWRLLRRQKELIDNWNNFSQILVLEIMEHVRNPWWKHEGEWRSGVRGQRSLNRSFVLFAVGLKFWHISHHLILLRSHWALVTWSSAPTAPSRGRPHVWQETLRGISSHFPGGFAEPLAPACFTIHLNSLVFSLRRWLSWGKITQQKILTSVSSSPSWIKQSSLVLINHLSHLQLISHIWIRIN